MAVNMDHGNLHTSVLLLFSSVLYIIFSLIPVRQLKRIRIFIVEFIENKVSNFNGIIPVVNLIIAVWIKKKSD